MSETEAGSGAPWSARTHKVSGANERQSCMVSYMRKSLSLLPCLPDGASDLVYRKWATAGEQPPLDPTAPAAPSALSVGLAGWQGA
jgi:hypothetical protein